VRSGDEITLRRRSQDLFPIQLAVDTVDRSGTEWLEVDAADRKVVIVNLPSRQQIDTQIQEQLVVELYSK
jgi:small subunit ribosomal protein S4